MFHIVHALVRWIAPVLSFTAEELWRYIPGNTDERDSVFLHTWYPSLFELDDSDTLDTDDWNTVIQVRIAVVKQLEALRVAATIGSSLDAELTLYCDGALFGTLAKLEDELRFVLIVSEAHLVEGQAPHDSTLTHIDGQSLWIVAHASEHAKCARCWHRRNDVGTHVAHPELCGRCVGNIEGEGECRRFA